ncbi:MAG: hypothetical protein ABIH23_32545 [bacterium]
MANVQGSGQFAAPTGPGTLDAIAASAYTVPTGRRLQITDMTGGTADALGAIIYIRNNTAATTLWQFFVSTVVPQTIRLAAPIEVAAAVQVGISVEGLTGGVGNRIIASWSGRIESP